MKRTIIFLFCFAVASIGGLAYGQVAPAAYEHRPTVTVGGLGSAFQPDYAGNGIAQSSPNPLVGIGGFVDVKLSRWVGFEAEGRWQRFNEYIGISEDNYLIGPRVQIVTMKGFTPYGKFMVGLGGGSYLTGKTTVLAYGGGVDYRLSKRWMVRVGDFEYQQWLLTPQLHPYGGSVGIGYNFFGR